MRSALEEALGVKVRRRERGVGLLPLHAGADSLLRRLLRLGALWARQIAPAPTAVLRLARNLLVWLPARPHSCRLCFSRLPAPDSLQSLDLVEVLDWTTAALDRVDRDAFFARFNEGEAVPYFYEPFLEAFDPALRKQLGVWYTPTEVVRYMVARVDRALKDDLGIEDGLAAENVYVLDPCCGTGAYLAETLKRIAANLRGKGVGALTGARVKQAATQRVFGFEIMPAPFVVAHLQVGLTMQALDAPLSDDGNERAWGVPDQRPHRLGAEDAEAAALPGAGGGAGPSRKGEAGHAGAGHPGQPALQRVRGHGSGRGAGAVRSLPYRQGGA